MPRSASRDSALDPGGGLGRPFFLFVTMLVMSLAGLEASASAGIDEQRPGVVRIATFNASLTRDTVGGLLRDLATQHDPQARAIARIVQTVRPNVLLINEFDYDASGQTLRHFATNYLERRQQSTRPIRYRYRFSAPVNTGVPSGLDLDRDDRNDGPGDALGFGRFPGQYGMAVFSQLPIDRRRVRTFRHLLWRDMPGALLPSGWYASEALAILPLSSKSHWDVPIDIGNGRRIHLLASHPTPPAFDGDEDRNGRRNHDEIRFWVDYLDPARASWIRDDAGKTGGLAAGAHFVIVGDLNADPNDGDSHPRAITQLLEHSRIRAAPVPQSSGAALAAARQGGSNVAQRGPSAEDTADFGDTLPSPGNLRVDYALPSRSLAICAGGVYWPDDDEVARASDHRLVWVDVTADRCPPPAPTQRSGAEDPAGQ